MFTLALSMTIMWIITLAVAHKAIAKLQKENNSLADYAIYYEHKLNESRAKVLKVARELKNVS